MADRQAFATGPARAVSAVGVLLLLANVLHLGADRGGVFASRAWNGEADGSVVEIFGHTQLAGAALLLLVLGVRRRAPLFAVWSAVLVVMTADDLLKIHERGGAWVRDRLDLPAVAGLRAQDLGELAVWALLGGVLLPWLVAAHRRSPRVQRAVSARLATLVVLLAVFAVGVDMLGIVLGPLVPPVVSTTVTLVETAGELFGMTLVLAFVLATSVRRGDDASEGGRDLSGPGVEPAGEGSLTKYLDVKIHAL